MTYLVEPPLQTALQDVVSRGPHVDVAIVPAWPLRVDAADPSRTLRQLTERYGMKTMSFMAKIPKTLDIRKKWCRYNVSTVLKGYCTSN